MESETASSDVTPDFQFSFLECLMYALHQLSRKYPDFLIAEENEERVKDFCLRYICSIEEMFGFTSSSIFIDYAISIVVHHRIQLN